MFISEEIFREFFITICNATKERVDEKCQV
jgi:hypothetical protein